MILLHLHGGENEVARGFPNNPTLIKSYVDLDNISVVPHMIKEVSNFKEL